MTDKRPSIDRRLTDAIRAQRTSNEHRDLTSLNRTLVKSGLWKQLTLERIESGRNGAADDSEDRVILQHLKSALGDVIEKFWHDLVRSAADKVVRDGDAESAEPANEDDARREATNARKLLALHETSMRQARYRLYEEWARVYVQNKRIECLADAIEVMKRSHGTKLDQQRTRYAKLQEAFEEFQNEADRLLEALDQENFRLKIEARRRQA